MFKYLLKFIKFAGKQRKHMIIALVFGLLQSIFTAFSLLATAVSYTHLDVYKRQLMALCSRRDYRKGLGTALWEAFQERCIQSGVKTVRVFTDTDATYTFYEKRGFKLVWEKPYSFGVPGKSLVYEYKL